MRFDASSGKTTLGPDSTGFRISTESLLFGGSTLTATDIASAAGRAPGIGDASLVKDIPRATVEAAQERIATMLQLTLDAMKTSSGEIPVYLVGGGSILAPDQIPGISRVHRFPHSDVANAVGAAIAQVGYFSKSQMNWLNLSRYLG